MNQSLLISIITVTYNAENSIDKTLRSISEQSYKNIEYLIIDGESQDKTLEIINKYSKSISNLISEKDRGIYDAMNKGLTIAHGDFVIFMGAGDVFYSDKTIETAVSYMVDKDAVYYGNAMMLPIQKLHWGKFNKIKLGIGNICHQTIFYPRCVYINYTYDDRYRLFADYVLNINLFVTHKFFYIPEVIAYYDIGGLSASKENDKEFAKDKDRLILKNLGVVPLLARYVYHNLLNFKHSCLELNNKSCSH